MQDALLVLAELVLLFFLSQSVVKSLSLLFFAITKSRKVTITLISILFFPGVLLHELSHYLVAMLLFVGVGELDLYPKFTDGEVRLGSVQIVKTDPIRRFFIGIAPLIVGLSVLLLGLYYALSSQFFMENVLFRIPVAAYLLFVVGNTMFSSRRDVEGALELLIALFVLSVALFFIGVNVTSFFVSLFSFIPQENMHRWVLLLLIPIAVDVGVLLWLRFLTNKPEV